MLLQGKANQELKDQNRTAILVRALQGYEGSELNSGPALEFFERLAERLLIEIDEKKKHDIAEKLLQIVKDETSATSRLSARELAIVLDRIYFSKHNCREHETFPTKLQSLDEIVSAALLGQEENTSPTCEWHSTVPGDGHVLQRWTCDKFSIVGIGRSADASAYYIPEFGIVFDAGIAVKSLVPKTILLSHGHRDHVQALPALARRARFGQQFSQQNATKIILPKNLEQLVRNFLYAENALNYGQSQTPQEIDHALGELDLLPVSGGQSFQLQRSAHLGPPLSVEVFDTPHKPNVPTCSYGLYRTKKRLKPEYNNATQDFIKKNRDLATYLVKDYLLFYSGDTTIRLLESHHDGTHILKNYKFIIHECTYLGAHHTDGDLDKITQRCTDSGHTHYLQLHPIISAHPHITFILVHFSTKYSRSDVHNFFTSNYGGVPPNVVLWI